MKLDGPLTEKLFEHALKAINDGSELMVISPKILVKLLSDIQNLKDQLSLIKKISSKSD